MHKDFDLIIIGGGPGGYVAAIKGAQAGLSVALVEKDRVGGTCLNRGCIPAKAMIHASSLYREMMEGGRFGIYAQDAVYDYEEMLRYKAETVDSLVGGVEGLLAANGVTVVRGTGTLLTAEDGKNRVRIACEDDQASVLTADQVILAAGSRPARIPAAGMDLDHVLDSDGLFALDHAPQSLVIIGGGVIGVEFATVFSNLGAEVTILEALPRLLDNFDKEISQNLKMILKKRGVETHLNASVKACLPGQDDWVSVVFEEKGKQQEITAEYVLVAAGRRPAAAGLFGPGVLEEAPGREGDDPDQVSGPAGQAASGQGEGADTRGQGASGRIRRKGPFIEVDAGMRTGMAGVYAIGDLTGGIQLAHAASAQGARAVEAICLDRAADPSNAEDPSSDGLPPAAGGSGIFSQDLDHIPSGVYTDPEIACVGLTEAGAMAAGIDAVTGKFIMTANGKSQVSREERGFIKVVADAGDHRILGAQMMCARATDMIGEFATAIANRLTAEDLLRGIRPHPTYNEGIQEALEALSGRSVHTMPRRRR